MKTLVILSSILGYRSHSKQLADHMVARIKQADPAAVVTIRDIGAQPLPYFDGATAGALFTPAAEVTNCSISATCGSRGGAVPPFAPPASASRRDRLTSTATDRVLIE